MQSLLCRSGQVLIVVVYDIQYRTLWSVRLAGMRSSNVSHTCKTNSTSQIIAHDSAIGQHFLENPFCASQYSDAKFSIFAQGHAFFYLYQFFST